MLWLIAFGIGFVVALSADGWLVRIVSAVAAIAAAQFAVQSLRNWCEILGWARVP